MRMMMEFLLLCLFLHGAGLMAAPAVDPVRRSVLDRFLRYAATDTAGDEKSKTLPTTASQREFANALARELEQMGLTEVRVSGEGYVYGTLPASANFKGGPAPVLGLICHMDTVPLSGDGPVKPVVHHTYQGGDIVLPGDPTQVLRPADQPRLLEKIGYDLVTSDGRTILGADDKAGVAEVLTALELLIREKKVPHGPVKVAFTPDEETGRGVEGFDATGWGAQFAFTVDGEQLGELNDETFNAASAQVVFNGRNCHPGSAKGIMINALYAASHFVGLFPADQRPETTDGRQGYLHPFEVSGTEETATVSVLLRDFSEQGLAAREKLLRTLAGHTQKAFPAVRIEVKVHQSYKSMKPVVDQHPFLLAAAEEALRLAGVTPIRIPIRGGTDGSALSYLGIPCPNLFTGAENVHSRTEWIAVEDMVKAVHTLVNLVRVWPKHASPTPQEKSRTGAKAKSRAAGAS